MPLYEYECDACGKRFELIQRFSDPPQEICTLCGGGPVRKLISSPAIQFKGTGWYVTDYASKDKGKSGDEGGKDKDKDKDSKPASSSSDSSKTSSSDSSSSTTSTSSGGSESTTKSS